MRRGKKRLAWGLALVVTAWAARSACGGGGAPVRIGTFNIEDYPKSERQEELAFEAIAGLGLEALAVQEITTPERFEAQARRRLGDDWRAVFAAGEGHRVGVLYDGAALELLSAETRWQTRLPEGGKPSLEARLRPRRGGDVVRMIVMHLKAGADGVSMRRRQLHAIESVVREGVRSGERVVVLGDFNATGDEDRRRILELCNATGMVWASEGLACTSFWDRQDGCLGWPLDHVLTRDEPRAIAARGPCETEGCGHADECPVFHREVSDHCPVTAEIP